MHGNRPSPRRKRQALFLVDLQSADDDRHRIYAELSDEEDVEEQPDKKKTRR